MMGLSALYTHSQELYPTQVRGLGVGWVSGIALLTGVIAPLLTGILYDMGGTPLTLHFCAGCYFIAGLVAYMLVEVRCEVQVMQECVPLKWSV